MAQNTFDDHKRINSSWQSSSFKHQTANATINTCICNFSTDKPNQIAFIFHKKKPCNKISTSKTLPYNKTIPRCVIHCNYKNLNRSIPTQILGAMACVKALTFIIPTGIKNHTTDIDLCTKGANDRVDTPPRNLNHSRRSGPGYVNSNFVPV